MRQYSKLFAETVKFSFQSKVHFHGSNKVTSEVQNQCVNARKDFKEQEREKI